MIPVSRNPLDAFGCRHIDQRNIRAVEGRQIFVIEARPLAQEPVVGLQRLSRFLVLDDAVDAAAHPLHRLVVFNLPEFHQLLERQLGPAYRLQLRRQVPADLGPAVADEVRLTRAKTDERRRMEIGLPLLLPALPQCLYHFGINPAGCRARRCRKASAGRRTGALA